VEESSEPLRNTRHEHFARLIAAGTMSNMAAYRKVFRSMKTKNDNVVSVQASRLRSLLSTRIAWLQKLEADKLIMSLRERRVALTSIARQALTGLKAFMQVTPDGEMVFDVTPENIHEGLESVTQTVKVTGEGGGPDTITRMIKLRDPIDAIRELNRMDRVYNEEIGESTKVYNIVMNIPLPPENPPEKPYVDVKQ
jgi:hypothetical protein